MVMSSTYRNIDSCILCMVFFCLYFNCCSSKDNITTGENIYEGTDYLESADKQFQMGFFKVGRTQRYIGIWYTKDPMTRVWVGNRDRPLQDSNGVLTISLDGEVKVLDEDPKNVYFNISTGGDPAKALKLLDSGNAVLIDTVSGSYKWESFQNPTDTFLPGMKMVTDLRLTSWKNVDDPSTGSFVFQQEDINQYFIQNTTDTTNYRWMNGRGSLKNFDPDQLFIGAYYLLSNSTKQVQQTNYCGTQTNNKTLKFCNGSTNSFVYNNARLLMNHIGNIQYFSWEEHEKKWVLDWQAPEDNCSIYRVCGKFGICSLSKHPSCSCLPEFEHITPGVYSDGCRQGSDKCNHTNDEFMNLTMIKVENPARPVLKLTNESECQKTCLQECSCKAYSYTPAKEEQLRSGRPDANNSCWIWDSDVYNLQRDGTRNISIRVFRDVQGDLNRTEAPFIAQTRILIFSVILLILLLGSLGYICYKRMVLTSEQGRNSMLHTDNNERWAIDLLNLDHSRIEDTEGIGIPFYDFKSIQVATDNFSDANKLGEGGFGAVYKVMIPNH